MGDRDAGVWYVALFELFSDQVLYITVVHDLLPAFSRVKMTGGSVEPGLIFQYRIDL